MGYSDELSLYLSLQTALYSGKKEDMLKAQLRLQVIQTALRQSATEDSILQQLLSLYIQLRQNQRNINCLIRNKELAQQKLDAATELYKLGSGTLNTVFTSEDELYSYNSQFQSLENTQKEILMQMEQLTGCPFNQQQIDLLCDISLPLPSKSNAFRSSDLQLELLDVQLNLSNTESIRIKQQYAPVLAIIAL